MASVWKTKGRATGNEAGEVAQDTFMDYCPCLTKGRKFIAPILHPSLQPHSLPCDFVVLIIKDIKTISVLLGFGFDQVTGFGQYSEV